MPRGFKVKPGLWIHQHVGRWNEDRAVITDVIGDITVIHRNLQRNNSFLRTHQVAERWTVMRTSYRTKYERNREMPDWVFPLGLFSVPYDKTGAVYQIVEVRGVWLLARDQLTDVPIFKRLEKLSRHRPVLTRFQRVG